MADRRPITSPRAIPRSCPSVLSCTLSGRRFAAHGRKVSEAIRSDLNGIVIEIGNAPLNPIQLGSYVKPGPFLSISIVPTRRCSKYTDRVAIRLLLFGNFRQFRGGRGLRTGVRCKDGQIKPRALATNRLRPSWQEGLPASRSI